MKISKTGMICVLAGVAGIGMAPQEAGAWWDWGWGDWDDRHGDDNGFPDPGKLTDGEYLLCNHPDGNRAEPYYGMVLEGLDRSKHGSKTFTFDFEHELSDMRMTVDSQAGSIRIFGSAYGGRDIGSVWADEALQGVYQIDFTYSTGVSLASGDDDYEVRSPAENFGYITTPLDDTYNLVDKAKEDGQKFRLGDEDDNNGHRGFDGISGWGWLKGNSDHDRRSRNIEGDFLFTVKPVPAPGTAVLGGLGLVCFTGRRRREEA